MTFNCDNSLDSKPRGFTLVEMTMVLVILGLVMAALLTPLSIQREQLARSESEKTLALAKKALLGFAQTKGRLPCPASDASHGLEDPSGGTSCTMQLGYLPAATLGIVPTDADGYAVDAWGNRMMYAVAQSSSTTTPSNTATPDFTTNNATDGMDVVGLSNLTPELRVCKTASGATATKCANDASGKEDALINNAVAVIYSLGITGSQPSGGADENLNARLPATAKSVFVSHDTTAANATNGEFDHIVTWISPYVLYHAMIATGQLH